MNDVALIFCFVFGPILLLIGLNVLGKRAAAKYARSTPPAWEPCPCHASDGRNCSLRKNHGGSCAMQYHVIVCPWAKQDGKDPTLKHACVLPMAHVGKHVALTHDGRRLEWNIADGFMTCTYGFLNDSHDKEEGNGVPSEDVDVTSV